MSVARIVPIVLIVALLAGCNLSSSNAPVPTAFRYVTPLPNSPGFDAPTPVASITPLAGGGAVSQTVYITATPAPGAAAQTIYVTATPFGSTAGQPVTPFGSGSGISIGITQGTPNPALSPTATSNNVIDTIINTVVIPAWNFLYTLVLNGVGSLWSFAGERGGLFAQGLCCLIPAVILTVAVVRLALTRRPRWLR